MARTKGSGWGGGVILYQKCPHCDKKKAMYDWTSFIGHLHFKCTSCKERFDSKDLIRKTYKSQIL